MFFLQNFYTCCGFAYVSPSTAKVSEGVHVNVPSLSFSESTVNVDPSGRVLSKVKKSSSVSLTVTENDASTPTVTLIVVKSIKIRGTWFAEITNNK